MQSEPLRLVPGGEQPLPRVRYLFVCEAPPERLWCVRRVSLTEELSQPYELTLDLLVNDTDLDAESLLASNCELSIDRGGLVRTVCGMVTRVELHDRVDDQLPLRLVIVPALRLLEQRVDTRLWQDRSALAVVEEVLSAALADYGRELDTSRLTCSYEARENIVQYHENDLAFVSRLLEDEGISYHFDHERGNGREVLVLEDSPDHWAEVPTLDDDPALHVIANRLEQAEVESLQQLTWARALRPTAVARWTFDWLAPLEPTSVELAMEPGPMREVYHHGRIVEADPGPRVVREFAHVRAGDRVLHGVSNVVGLAPGRRFRVAALDRPELELDEFLITRVISRGDCPEVELGETGGDEEFVNEFECVELDAKPWRPPVRTPVPKLHGPQTAIVTGPEGEEIHTDEHGRIKVRFDWDRQHALTDDTSMWIRVAHSWAGSGFGALFIPRVGMEVVVEFIEGDPDRPLVTGCVYNGEAAASVALPDSKTQSTIRTQSSPGGAGYNELRFEDAAGSEEIFVHAQRDFREAVGRNRSTTIGHDRGETIGGDHRQTVKGAQTLMVEGTRTHTVRGDETRIREQSRTTTIHGDDRLEVDGHTAAVHHRSLEQRITGSFDTRVIAAEGGIARAQTHVEGDHQVQVRNAATLTAGDRVELVQGSPTARVRAVFADGSLGLDAEQEWRATAGTDAALKAGSSLELTGTNRVELRQGAASIRLENDVVVIDAREIQLVVGGNKLVLSESGLRCETAKVEMTTGGPVTIQGATVTID